MNDLLSAVLKEAYALAPATVEHIHSLEISHPAIGEAVYICQGMQNRVLTIPGVGEKTFIAAPFNFTLPKVDDGGLQELNLTFDNVDRSISDFCRAALAQPYPIEIKYRPYISSDLTTPQYDPPLLLFLLNVQVKTSEVSGRAVPRDFINRKFPNFRYTTRDFPGLKNL